MDTLPDLEAISAQMNEATKEHDETINNKDMLDLIGSKLDIIPDPNKIGSKHPSMNELEVSASSPRMKLMFSFHEAGMVFSSPKDGMITLQPADVQHVIVFPRREDCPQPPKMNKEGTAIHIPGSYVLFILSPDRVEFRKKKLDQICIQLPQHYSDIIFGGDNMTAQELTKICVDHFEQTIVDNIENCLHLHNRVYRIYNPKYHNIDRIGTYCFKSDDGGAEKTIMNGSMPYIKCYSGVNDGVLYPMEQGLLFFKPPSFIHRSQLHSIAVGRGGGARYIDIHASINDGKTQLEFTNIDREEMNVLNSYIHNTLVKAMAQDIAKADDLLNRGEDVEVSADLTHPSEEEDDGNTSKRPRRAAFELAQKITRKELKIEDDESESAEDEYHAEEDSIESGDDSDDSDEEMQDENDSGSDDEEDDEHGDTESEDGDGEEDD